METSSLALPLENALVRYGSAAWRYLRGGPGHFLMYVFGRFRVIRTAVLFSYRLRFPNSSSSIINKTGTSQLEDVDFAAAVAALSSDGLFSGLRLRPQALEAIRRFSLTATCFAEENFAVPFTLSERAEAEQRYERKIRVGRLDNALQACPEVRALASDPVLLAIAGEYFGCEPVLLGSRIWWSFASGANSAQQMSLGQGFHYDIDGYKALAFFFYLTDVGPECGPHVYVKGSHTEKPLKSLLALHKGRSDAEITRWYGTNRQITLCGSAGCGFAEDIFCFHKGVHPERGDRLILQLRFGLRNYDKAPN